MFSGKDAKKDRLIWKNYYMGENINLLHKFFKKILEIVDYRILRNKRLPPNKRPPSLFVIANNIESKGMSEVFKEIDAK